MKISSYSVATLLAVMLFAIPSVSFAATLTQSQVNAILALLSAFNVDASTIASVTRALEPTAQSTITPTASPQITSSALGQTAHGTSSLDPVAPSGPITINTQKLTNLWRDYFKNASTTVGYSLHGTVDLWHDQLVMQGDQDIWDGVDITYSLDGATLGSPSGVLGDYSFPLNTTKYTNGTHTLTISADDSRGNTAAQSVEIDIKN